MRIKGANVIANSDGTYTVTLQRNILLVTCADIELWDEASVNEDLFIEWAEYACNNEEGYALYKIL